MHDVLIVSVPLVTILAGLFFNNASVRELRGEMRTEMKDLRSEMKDLRSEMKDLRSEMKDLRSEMNRRFDEIDTEQRYFHGITGELKGRIDALEKRH